MRAGNRLQIPTCNNRQHAQVSDNMNNITSSTTSNHYRIHGEFDVSVDGQILISRVFGPWNFEAVEAYGIEVNKKIQLLAGKPWGLLAVIGGEPFHSPKSIEELIHIVRSHRKLGRCGTALVLVDVESPILVKLILSQIYVKAEEPFYFAADETSAIVWLNDKIIKQQARTDRQF